jgi:hypothetical protein
MEWLVRHSRRGVVVLEPWRGEGKEEISFTSPSGPRAACNSGLQLRRAWQARFGDGARSIGS